MIYTVTFNPSLDLAVTADSISFGTINKSSSETILAGGKGINVSTVLHHLGCESVALGFIAGFTGNEIDRMLLADGVRTDFIRLPEGNSRINIKLKAQEETEINASGPDIPEKQLSQLMEKLDGLTEGDYLVLAGSIPASLPDTIYKDIMVALKEKGVCIIVDASRTLLVNVLEQRPFLIKPNNIELAEIFGLPSLTDKKEVIRYAKELQKKGARNVLVSMAGDGAVFVSEDGQELMSDAPSGTVVNSVGAGDSMVAGFLAGYIKSGSFGEALRLGIAAGSASTFSRYLASKQDIDEILKRF